MYELTCSVHCTLAHWTHSYISSTEKEVLWMDCGVLVLGEGKLNLLWKPPLSLRQRRPWHSGGMLTDTDSGLKPQWYIFLTLLLTQTSQGFKLGAFLRDADFSQPWRKVRGLQHCRSMMRSARTYTIALSQYHHNHFFPKEVIWTCVSSCLLSAEKATTGFSTEEGPRLQKCLVFPTSFTKPLTHDVTKWCFYGTNAEQRHKTHPWTFLEACQAPCVVLYKLTNSKNM